MFKQHKKNNAYIGRKKSNVLDVFPNDLNNEIFVDEVLFKLYKRHRLLD